MILQTLSEVSYVPFCDEFVFLSHNLKQLVTGLLAVACVEEMLQWHRPLQRADHIQLLALGVADNNE